MKNQTVPIKGMHCRSCELLIEDELLKVDGVKKVIANEKKGEAEIHYQGNLNSNQIEQAVIEAGYQVGINEQKPLISTNIKDYQELGLAFLFMIVLYLIGKEIGLFDLAVSSVGNYNSLPIVFLVGLTAGVSTCMALVGGLVLGVSARFVEKHPNSSPIQKFKPHLFFNIGRIISFFILGGLIGYAGSIFQLSSSILGLLIIAVGVIMVLLGMQLINIFPRFKGINFSLPKNLSHVLGFREKIQKEYSHTNSIILGGLTFFLPCGFTQAMQLFAISSGSPITGALTMGIFALGTAPGLLGIGGLTSILKGAITKPFFKFAGLVVISLALFNIYNGLNLAGVNVNAFINDKTPIQADDPNVVIENGVQIVRMDQLSNGYSPNSFTIKKGIPVKWIITSKSAFSCAASIISSKLGVRKFLQEGNNIIEFTPTEIGTIQFSCSMGMYSGQFNVIDESL